MYLITGLVNTRGMSFRDGTEKVTIVAAGGLVKYAVDLKPVNLALVLPEKVPLLQLDVDVISNFWVHTVVFFLLSFNHFIFTG